MIWLVIVGSVIAVSLADSIALLRITVSTRSHDQEPLRQTHSPFDETVPREQPSEHAGSPHVVPRRTSLVHPVLRSPCPA